MGCAQLTARLGVFDAILSSPVEAQVLVWVKREAVAVAAGQVLAASTGAVRIVEMGAMKMVPTVLHTIVVDNHRANNALADAVWLVCTFEAFGECAVMAFSGCPRQQPLLDRASQLFLVTKGHITTRNCVALVCLSEMRTGAALPNMRRQDFADPCADARVAHS